MHIFISTLRKESYTIILCVRKPDLAEKLAQMPINCVGMARVVK